MTLDNNQRKTLREALLKAYADEEELQLMLEDELDIQLNTITQGKKYNLTVNNLIKWAEQAGKLRELLIGASKANPGNPVLRSCVKDLLPVLLDDIDDNILKPELLTSLIKIIKSFPEFDLVKDCCTLTIPDLSIHRPQQVLELDDTKLEAGVKWLIVLGLFLKDFPQKVNGIPYIIHFVDRLQSRVRQQPIHHHLCCWLEQVQQCYNYKLKDKLKDKPKQEIVTLQGHLLILVRIPSTSGEKVLVNRFISIKKIQQDGAIQSQLIVPQEVDLSADIDRISQRGVSCTLKQIEENMWKWVHDAETTLGNEADKLNSPYSLTIEFFLPYEYLEKAVDQWKVLVGSPRLNKFKAIGRKHRVVVRSLDRMEDCDLLNQLRKIWQNGEQFWQNNPSQTEICTKIEQLDCPIDCNSEDLTRRLEKSRLALELTCLKPTCTMSCNSTNLADLFLSILEAGTPIALWSRQCNLSDVKLTMEKLLVSEILCNPNSLLQEVQKIRKAAQTDNDRDLGHHLAILYDEPQRLTEIKRLLNKNKLWGMSV